jgi:hypothetical protein
MDCKGIVSHPMCITFRSDRLTGTANSIPMKDNLVWLYVLGVAEAAVKAPITIMSERDYRFTIKILVKFAVEGCMQLKLETVFYLQTNG